MVDGVVMDHGAHVQKPVVMVHKLEHEHVLILYLQMVVITVQEATQKLKTVTHRIVLVQSVSYLNKLILNV